MKVDDKTREQRLKVCQNCPHWIGGCSRGHYLTSPTGCPLKKFAPLRNFDYAVDRPKAVNLWGCCGE